MTFRKLRRQPVLLLQGLRTPGNMFVLNLTLADLIVTVFVDPFNVLGEAKSGTCISERVIPLEHGPSACYRGLIVKRRK